MELQNEVQTFTRLGLTFNQARVYLALAHSGVTSALAISKISGVTRPDVYRVMPTLEKLGLVEKILSVPCKHKAISMDHAIHALIDRRAGETMDLQTMAKEVLQKFNNNNGRLVPEDEPQFTMVPQKEANISKRRILIQNVQSSIDTVSSLRRFRSSVLVEEITKALRRGVKIRVIIEKHENKRELTEIVKKFRKAGNYNIRYSLSPPQTVLSIYDKKQALITTSAAAGVAESPALWSNNHSLLALLQEHFENIWQESIKQDYPGLTK